MIHGNRTSLLFLRTVILSTLCLTAGCKNQTTNPPTQKTVPHEARWGIYALDLATQAVDLIYSSQRKIETVRLSHAGRRFVFTLFLDGDANERQEICTLDIDGSDFKRLTDNNLWDLYPCFAPGDTQIAFLSMRNGTLDIYTMTSEGEDQARLYDSGFHDADIHWVGDKIAFTRNSQVWTIQSDGTEPTQITDPPNAGEWGTAVLPFGDYDPRCNPTGDRIVFERMVSDSSVHGCYDIFVVNAAGTGETRLTHTGYTQGLANWSHTGDRIVYIVEAIGDQGVFDIFSMNADGTDSHNITPEYFPATFLCHCPLFSADDSKIYFAGEWWE